MEGSKSISKAILLIPVWEGGGFSFSLPHPLYTTFKKSTAIWKVCKVRLRYIILINYFRCMNEQPRAYKKMKELLWPDFRWGFADFLRLVLHSFFVFLCLAGFRAEFTSRQCCGSVAFWYGQQIRIRGAVPQINGSGYFCQWASRWQLKIIFFAYYFLSRESRWRRPRRVRITPPRLLSRPCVSDLLWCIRPKAATRCNPRWIDPPTRVMSVIWVWPYATFIVFVSSSSG